MNFRLWELCPGAWLPGCILWVGGGLRPEGGPAGAVGGARQVRGGGGVVWDLQALLCASPPPCNTTLTHSFQHQISTS